ncbi:glutamate decarboxylase [Blumeria hordei DH14]|uniref:Glutamate decarboxylase n=1 Tax=Blumeria graminis f. sp. hordei (strain DH14) TaxID=546991 RepID=N1J9M6_BLUG1|nr:glutamate decarboxylase [Blumeria hordei DH14]
MVHLACIPNDKDDNENLAEEVEKLAFNTATQNDVSNASIYGSIYSTQQVPMYEIPEDELPKEVAYRMIKDDLSLDGNPVLNLASFVTTYMEKEAEDLMMESLSKNFIDYEIYPQTAEIQNRCVSMIGSLFHAPSSQGSQLIGTSCVGSSEAIMLATIAMKKRWQNSRKATGSSWDKPNLVMSSAVQVCWEKAARYFEIEEKYVFCTPDRHVIDPVEAVSLVDENTIGICVLLGTTYTGEYEDVKAINDLLIEKNIDVVIHVDAASGGFVAPFVVPELEWDFRLEKVVSINASGHKYASRLYYFDNTDTARYGLVYPGVGWVVWRAPEFLPQELVFNINYLGANQASFTLNFSKGASQVIGQYYQFLRLGKHGYKAIMTNLTNTADYLSERLQKLGFIIMSQRSGKGLPIVAFRFDPMARKSYDEFVLARELRSHYWVVPAYTMAPNANNLKMLRIVVREDFSRTRCNQLLRDLKQCLQFLDLMNPEESKNYVAQISPRLAHGKNGEQSPLNYKNEKHSLQGRTGKTHAVC